MRRRVGRFVALLAATAAAAAMAGCTERSQPAEPELEGVTVMPVGAHAGATALTAVVEFGREDVGSPFPPPSGHDQSIHAKDKLYPRTTVIARGGTVTFIVAPIHRPAVYEPGIEPEDIDTSNLLPLPIPPFIPNFVIDDPTGRIAQASYSTTTQSWSHTFPTPGKYLVICTTLPHFAGANMYGWVEVK